VLETALKDIGFYVSRDIFASQCQCSCAVCRSWYLPGLRIRQSVCGAFRRLHRVHT